MDTDPDMYGEETMGGVTEPSELLVVEVVIDDGAFGFLQLQYNFGRLHWRHDVEARILSKLLKFVLILFTVVMLAGIVTLD